MNWFNKIFEFILRHRLFLRNCLVILVLSRLFALEKDHLALIAEICASVVIILGILTTPQKDLKDKIASDDEVD